MGLVFFVWLFFFCYGGFFGVVFLFFFFLSEDQICLIFSGYTVLSTSVEKVLLDDRKTA